MLVPSTTKSNGRLALTVTWKSMSGTGSGCRSSLKEPMSLDGAPVAPSSHPSLAFCCIKCQRSADDGVDNLAENVKNENDKWATNGSPSTSQPMTIDNHMPKARNRNRNQPTTALLKPAMHRKSKSKSRSMSHVHPTTTRTRATNCAGPQHIKHVDKTQLNPHSHPRSQTSRVIATEQQQNTECSTRINISNKKKKAHSSRYKMVVSPLPSLRATSFVTLLTIICIETVLLSTMSSCAKTFYMHWNTSNSIFRIDNTDHIIDVNKGNLAFEFDQVHIICPVYEPGAFENETEKYIIYNVSKVEYETCRITNADPRVIAICDKPQKLMFFTITFRPFTPQPGGLEFLPGNDYYFISTSSKDDLYRRIGGRCSTNNMKVVFKVCCAAEDKNKTTETTLLGSVPAESGTGNGNGVDSAGVNVDQNLNTNANHGHGHNGVNTIGTNTGFIPGGSAGGSSAGGGGGVQLKPINGMMGTSINTNIDQFNRIPIQPNNVMGNNIGAAGAGGSGTGGIMLSPGHGSINMLPPGRGGGVHMTYPGHHHIQTGIRINNVPTQPNNQHPHHKGNMNVNSNNDDHHNYDKHPNEVVKNEELTYNSGSGQATRSHIWIWTWLAGGAATRGLTSMHVYGINSTLLLAIIVITFQYLFWAPAAHTMRRRQEPLAINYR
ncbi:uncharacterized protein Ephrin [Drosophila montana]|uniref:uncharacterized protein Ephrin n=1 Tax=Drosophila montana TaxID=40370 RepID=UPI00313A7634